MPDEVALHRAGNTLAHNLHQNTVPETRHCPDDEHTGHRQRDPEDRIALASHENAVEHRLDQIGQKPQHPAFDSHQDKRNNHEHLVFAQIPVPEPFDQRAVTQAVSCLWICGRTL